MRALIISDIHSNRTALEIVLADAGPVDQVWCLGDIVGYGPDPNECVDILRNLPQMTSIIGNHDAAVCDQIPHEVFNPEARHAIQWTRKTLRQDNLDWLCSLSDRTEVESVTLAHGSPRNPVWEYLLDPGTAGINFSYFTTDLCFVGHTHLPILYHKLAQHRQAQWSIPVFNQPIVLSGRYIINPGSVGQPRDRDPRASYGIYESTTQTWLPKRVTYPVQEVQERIIAAHLPERHAVRLSDGW
jgi:diadenosine tetraphosphatase ApaH/serine/threonine PP2A family protein phosphatase